MLWNGVPIIKNTNPFMVGMKALPHVGDFSQEEGHINSTCFDGFKDGTLLAPEYGKPAMQLDKYLSSVSLVLKAVPHVVNTASSIAKTK